MESSRRIASWYPVVGGPIMALVAFVLAYYYDPLHFGSQKPLAALPAFFVSLLILVVTHNINSRTELMRAAEYSDRIYDAVRDYLHVTKVGSAEVAFDYVLTRLPILDEVRNTSFNLRGELERANEKFYESKTYVDSAQKIAERSAKGLLWKDVGDSFALDRLRNVDHRAKELAGTRRSGYSYRVLNHDEPQINFIILTYPSGSPEVLFNWDFRRIGQDPVVLLSRDRDIVEMFAIQFELLWRASSADHDSSAT